MKTSPSLEKPRIHLEFPPGPDAGAIVAHPQTMAACQIYISSATPSDNVARVFDAAGSVN